MYRLRRVPNESRDVYCAEVENIIFVITPSMCIYGLTATLSFNIIHNGYYILFILYAGKICLYFYLCFLVKLFYLYYISIKKMPLNIMNTLCDFSFVIIILKFSSDLVIRTCC